MCRLTSPNRAHGSAGFTLIEVVVTLAVIAAVLLSIGSLVSAAVRGTRALDDHLALVETARLVESSLPDSNSLSTGTLSGVSSGLRWRVDIQPFSGTLGAESATPWVPLTVSITVQTRDGTRLNVTTLRLGRRPPG